jgi:hypothetical protein
LFFHWCLNYIGKNGNAIYISIYLMAISTKMTHPHRLSVKAIVNEGLLMNTNMPIYTLYFDYFNYSINFEVIAIL